jgi:hypothetical protein
MKLASPWTLSVSNTESFVLLVLTFDLEAAWFGVVVFYSEFGLILCKITFHIVKHFIVIFKLEKVAHALEV